MAGMESSPHGESFPRSSPGTQCYEEFVTATFLVRRMFMECDYLFQRVLFRWFSDRC